MVAFPRDPDRRRWLDRSAERFAGMLPEIRQEAGAALSAFPSRRRNELIEEVILRALQTFFYFAMRGKVHLVYAKPLTLTAVKQLGVHRNPRKPR